jgi:hypothetical protein
MLAGILLALASGMVSSARLALISSLHPIQMA